MNRNPHHTKKGPGRVHRDGRAYREAASRRKVAARESRGFMAGGFFDGMAGRFRSAMGLGQ